MIRALLAFLALFAATPVLAEALGTSNHIVPTLVAESGTPAPGQRVTLAFAMKPDATWHGYWQNPGDAGMPTLVEWTADKRLAFGPLQYPVPETLMIAGIMNYVYEHDYAMLVTLDVPKGLAPGATLPIKAKLDWLACNPQVCVPETKTLDIVLTVGDGHVDPAEAARFDHWRAALPRPLGSPAHFQIDGKSFRLEVPLPAAASADKPYFFPLTDKVVDYAAPQSVTREGDRLDRSTTAAKDGAKPDKVEGVLRLGARAAASLFTAGALRHGRRRHGGRRERGQRSQRTFHARGARRRDPRRAAAQHHALRLPDPQPQGAEPRPLGQVGSSMRGARPWPTPLASSLVCLALGAFDARAARAGPVRRLGVPACRTSA
jgi:DsbC/DsbD-like thiol-disulfide interchange protein